MSVKKNDLTEEIKDFLGVKTRKDVWRFLIADVGTIIALIIVALVFSGCTCAYPGIPYQQFVDQNLTFLYDNLTEALVRNITFRPSPFRWWP